MRYIRTKDGRIVDTTKYPDTPASWSVQASDYALTIKQSENLEELCDEFVIALKDSKKNPNDNMYDKEEYYSIFQHIGYAKNYYDEDYNDLYGCIWTDKGLIYVAKMNDKGDLELI